MGKISKVCAVFVAAAVVALTTAAGAASASTTHARSGAVPNVTAVEYA